MVIQDEVVLAEALTRGDRPGRALDLAEPDGVLLLFLLRNLRRPRVMEDEAQPEPAAPEIQARIRASFERQGLMRHLGARLTSLGQRPWLPRR
jgi:hypothetical protein